MSVVTDRWTDIFVANAVQPNISMLGLNVCLLLVCDYREYDMGWYYVFDSATIILQSLKILYWDLHGRYPSLNSCTALSTLRSWLQFLHVLKYSGLCSLSFPLWSCGLVTHFNNRIYTLAAQNQEFGGHMSFILRPSTIRLLFMHWWNCTTLPSFFRNCAQITFWM